MQTSAHGRENKEPRRQSEEMTSEREGLDLRALAIRVRSPTATLPAKADEYWFRQHIHFVPADIRRIHEDKEWIRSVTGYPWPETRPTNDEMPRLFTEAMRYPAFSLFAQHRIFGAHTATTRGFPKAAQFRLILDAFVKAHRDPEYTDKMSADVAPLRTLAVLDMTSNEEHAIIDILSLPGRAGASAFCDRVALGLEEVVARGGDVGEAGRYALDVVSAFMGFGAETTVQEAFNEMMLAEPSAASAFTRAYEESAVRSDDGETEPSLTQVQRADESKSTSAAPVSPELAGETEGINEAAEVNRQWRGEVDALRALAAEASAVGPSEAIMVKLRAVLNSLARLKDRAEALAPLNVETAQLIEKLRTLIGAVSASLVALVGEIEEVADIESGLGAVADQVPAKVLVEAESRERQADDSFELAREVAKKIEHNEQSLPRKKAHDLNELLLVAQETHLRASLNFMASSIATLRSASVVVQLEGTALLDPIANAVQPALGPPATETEPLASPGAATAHGTVVVDLDLDEEDEFSEDGDEDTSPGDTTADILPPAPAEERDQPPPADPLRDTVVEALDRLFVLGEFGLAHHLATATSRLMPDIDLFYDPLEFRLAAAAGRYSGLSGQEIEGLLNARHDAREIAQELDGKDDPRSIARRTMLLVGAIPAALFRQDDAGATGLVDQIGAIGSTSPFFQLVSAVDENRKRGFPITGANLAAAAAMSHETQFVEQSVQEIRESIDGFKAARFRFSLGERIRHAILGSEGVLGKLERGLSGDAHRSVKEAGDTLSTRDRALELLTKLTEELNNRQEIDGPARERLIGLLTHIGQQCEDLAQSMDELSSLRRGGSRVDSITRLRDLVVSGIERVGTETSSPSGSPLVDAAYRHANRMLTGLLPVFRGRTATERDAMPLAVSLHAPLLWLPGLSWSGGWLPSPYETEALIQKILEVQILLIGDNATASLEKAFQARKGEGAFVAATMLLNIARWYGLSPERIAELRAKLDADKDVRKAHIRGRLDEVIRLVDRMRRMAIGGLEQSNRMKETLETIDPSRLPVELPPDFLPEAITGERVEDFNAALSRIQGVEKEAKRELAKAEEEYSRRINALCSGGELEGETGRELRSLLESHELTTLADWLNMMEKGENRRPPSQSGPLNRRLLTFRENMPSLGQVELHRLAEAIRSGSTFGPLDYGVLDEEQRDDAARAVSALITLKQAMKGNAHPSQVQAHMMEAVSGLFYDVSQVKDSDLTQRRRQIYVYDAKAVMPSADPSSLVLPEFGSNTQGAWRIAVVGGTTVSTGELIALSEGSSTVIVFVLGYLNRDRRAQIRSDLIKRKRPMLFVDEALIASALADPEDRRRALVEIAQGYSYADPYKDYGRAPVPPEMFKGRTHERAAILDPFGSYVVYGGRRLGKTALLRHIASRSLKNTEVAFVDLYNLTAEADVFEKVANAFRQEVIKPTVRTGQSFVAAIQTWLSQDDRRRVLLLLDEADTFVRHEAETGFRCISAMLQLQADTSNRFKFVLAGLHNVSRAVRAENSPLVQISNNPLRIGPLVDRDVADAEFLVRGPLAAMGWEFDRREDVWRILSFTNYYPVLIQIFCQELVRLLHDEALQPAGKLGRNISATMVEKALSSSEVRRKLFETFDKTISDIEQRYKLLTYILARRELAERQSGMSGEGLTSAEVAEEAIYWWPKAFLKGSDPIEIEYLLEEMEGFGISRRTASARFALRSRMLLELMATDEDDLDNKLKQFLNRDAPPRPFDPKNHRRILGRTPLRSQSEGRVSPLTDGQEADLLTPGAERPVSVVFGCPAAGIGLVEAALVSGRRARDRQVDVEVKSFPGKKEFLDNARAPVRSGLTKVLAVSSSCSWTPEWVVEAERLPMARNGSLRIVLIGGPRHAYEWASDPVLRKLDLPNVRRVKLRPWTRSFLATRMEECQVDPDLLDEVRHATGGWSEIVDPLINLIADISVAEARAKIALARQAAVASKSTPYELGVPPDLSDFMRMLAQYADGSTVTTKDFQDLCHEEKLDPKVVGTHSDLVGLLLFPPDEGGDHLHRSVDFNPLALATLTEPE